MILVMKNNKIIKAFDYLITDYNCSLNFEENQGEHYSFQNAKFKLKIYVWEQFDELDINLIYNDECYHIDPYIEDFSLITKRKGLKGFFFSYSEKFWMIIAKIVKNKIKEILK